jgi:mRNA-degrading endonuclease RelE of RelBE toxin-antitoxin system
MRKLAISNRALAKLKRLELNDRERAADAIAQLQNGKDLTVRMLASEAAPELWAFQSGELRIVFRQLGGKIIVLGVFKHAPISSGAAMEQVTKRVQRGPKKSISA